MDRSCICEKKRTFKHFHVSN